MIKSHTFAFCCCCLLIFTPSTKSENIEQPKKKSLFFLKKKNLSNSKVNFNERTVDLFFLLFSDACRLNHSKGIYLTQTFNANFHDNFANFANFASQFLSQFEFKYIKNIQKSVKHVKLCRMRVRVCVFRSIFRSLNRCHS